MATTWGSTTVNIMPGTYRPSHADAGIVEIPILPDGSANAMSVIQQSGRRRKRISWQGYVTAWAGYEAFWNDYVAATERTFTDSDTVTLSCIIFDLSEPEYVIDGHIRYSITLMEA